MRSRRRGLAPQRSDRPDRRTSATTRADHAGAATCRQPAVAEPLHAVPLRCGGRAGRRRAAAGDLLHLQPRSAATRRVQQCLRAGLRLTTPHERRRDPASASRSGCAHLPDEDLHVLGLPRLRSTALSRGIAAHHAGMLPTFKECVEELFARGLVQGRVRHRDARAGHQHAGPVGRHREARASGTARRTPTSRRGSTPSSPVGPGGAASTSRATASCCGSRASTRKAVAGLASTRTYPLRSSLPAVVQHGGQPRPPGRADRPRASCSSRRSRSSRPTRPWSGWRGSCARPRRRSRGTPSRPTCHLGDFMEYAGLRRQLSDAEAAAARAPQGRPARRGRWTRSRRCGPGDVIEVPDRASTPASRVVIDPGTRSDRDGPRPYVLTEDRQARRLSMVDFPTPVEALDPDEGAAKTSTAATPQSRRELAIVAAHPHARARRRRRRRGGAAATAARRRRTTARSAGCGRELRAHPCHGCADREYHARWAERHHRLERETAHAAAAHRVSARTRSPASSTGSATC